MKKKVLGMVSLCFTIFLLGACGIDSTDLSKQINDFVVSSYFMEYNANFNAFDKAKAKDGILPYSIAETEKIGKNTYRTTVEGQINENEDDPYEKYLTLTITATPDEEGNLNMLEFSRTSEYSQWFNITEIKKEKNYQRMLALSKKDKDLVSTLPVDGNFNDPMYENGMYRDIKQYYEIQNKKEELSASYEPDSGITSALSAYFDDPNTVSTVDPQVLKNVQNKIAALDLAETIEKVQYVSIGRISKNYYAILLAENADFHDPKVLILYQDTDENDTALSKLQFVDVLKLEK